MFPISKGSVLWNEPTVFPSPSRSFGTGFTATIPRCYDGDTCHAKIFFDGDPLPDLFHTLNIRILGIDAPEIRSAKCDLERCLAVRAKVELERIVGAGSFEEVPLVDCRHDKYGGRITCDAVSPSGRRVSTEMLKTGLAVEYYGKRKEHSWCEVDQWVSLLSARGEDRSLYQHLLACGWDLEETDDEGLELDDDEVDFM